MMVVNVMNFQKALWCCDICQFWHLQVMPWWCPVSHLWLMTDDLSCLLVAGNFMWILISDKCWTFDLERGNFNIKSNIMIISFMLLRSQKYKKYFQASLQLPNQFPNHGQICLQCSLLLCPSFYQGIVRYKGVLFIDPGRGTGEGGWLLYFLLNCCVVIIVINTPDQSNYGAAAKIRRF